MSKIDTLRIDTPSGMEELEKLRQLKVGDTRDGVFMAAVPEPLQWKCIHAGEKFWALQGTFCGVPMMTAEINLVSHCLILNLKEEVV